MENEPILIINSTNPYFDVDQAIKNIFKSDALDSNFLRSSPFIFASNDIGKWTTEINNKLLKRYSKLEGKHKIKNNIYTEISKEFTQEFKKEYTMDAGRVQYYVLKRMEKFAKNKGREKSSWQMDKIKKMISNLSNENKTSSYIAEQLKKTFKIKTSIENIKKWVSVLKDELNVFVPLEDSKNIKEGSIEKLNLIHPQSSQTPNENNINVNLFAKEPVANMDDNNEQDNFSFEGHL